MYAPVAANAIRSPGPRSSRHRHVVGEHVARLAVLADHGDGRDPRHRVAGTVRRQRLESGVVEHRPKVVGHPAVDGDEGAATGVLAGPDRVEGDDRVRHEGAAGLGHERRAARGPSSAQRASSRARRESATSAGSRPGSSTYGTANPPPRSSTRTGAIRGVAHAQRQAEQGVERRLVRGDVGHLRPDVGVQAVEPQPGERHGQSNHILGLGQRRPELRGRVAGGDRLVRRGPDARGRPAAGPAASGRPHARSRRGAGARRGHPRSRGRVRRRPRAEAPHRTCCSRGARRGRRGPPRAGTPRPRRRSTPAGPALPRARSGSPRAP